MFKVRLFFPEVLYAQQQHTVMCFQTDLLKKKKKKLVWQSERKLISSGNHYKTYFEPENPEKNYKIYSVLDLSS